jgi:hypothetical protein
MAAKSAEGTPRIDGFFNDSFWQNADFKQYDFIKFAPNNGSLSESPSEVIIIYNDFGIYIAAKLKDASPEGIEREFSIRDDDNKNTDQFGVIIDTYQKGQNAFYFKVSAAGVQTDIAISRNNQDYNWDAVWRSAVQLSPEGWQVEIEIPYAALRFAKQEEQQWGINFMRKIQRLNEVSYWNFVDNSINGLINQSGTLTNLKNLTPPLRLSLSPYLTAYANKVGDETSFTSTVGADLKYGISESFTLDMTLLPDFGQVVSDNLIYNIGPYEVFYSENRPFFTEGVELFDRGGLFYSRRVGQSAFSPTMKGNDTLISRPSEAPLLNATKVTGRLRNGTGLGIFNAVTNRTYAKVRDTLTGQIREVQVDDLTNYNAVVIDQNLKNNSSVSFINTNVQRLDGGDDANVMGADFNFQDKTNTYRLGGFGAYNLISDATVKISDGYTYRVNVAKISGKYQFDVGRNVESDTYNPNDFGFLRRPNRVIYYASGSYNQFQPTWIFNQFNVRLATDYSQLYKPRTYQQFGMGTRFWGRLRNFQELSMSVNYRPLRNFDFFEPREEGYKFFRPRNISTRIGFATDSRKKLMLNMNTGIRSAKERDQLDYWVGLSPRFRVNNQLSLDYSIDYNMQLSSIGFAEKQYDEQDQLQQIVFGERDIQTINNFLQVNYIINNRSGLNFRFRHYWSKVDYFNYFELLSDGDIVDIAFDGKEEGDAYETHDVNYNAFSIDAVYSWQIAPGSFLNVVYKDNLQESNSFVDLNYSENIRDVFSTTHNQSVSVRLIFYLDYATIKRNLNN